MIGLVEVLGKGSNRVCEYNGKEVMGIIEFLDRNYMRFVLLSLGNF